MTVTVTFLRMRPAERVFPVQIASRRCEGTTSLEGVSFSSEELEAIHSGGLLSVSSQLDCSSAGWLIRPEQAIETVERKIPGWRLTLECGADRRSLIDALSRSGARYLRTGRSQVKKAVEILDIPGLRSKISVFVDDVDQAWEAVESGAEDLLLRDWDVERIGELRTRLGGIRLIERPAFPTGIRYQTARRELPSGVFSAWLAQTDGSGTIRPDYSWAPGRSEPVPAPPKRFSAQWRDSIWIQGSAPANLAGAGDLTPILEKSLGGSRPNRDEVRRLFDARDDQVDAIAWTADRLRSSAVGDTVTFVINRNINYTNVCRFRCGFCAFSRGSHDKDPRGRFLMDSAEVVALAREAWERGATEVTLQGGIHPAFDGDFYLNLVRAVKSELPDIHVHGFSPLEVWQGASTLGISVREFLVRLADAGLGTLPGTAAEILDDRIRRDLCPDKITTAEWAEVVTTAHQIGLKTTSTMMFGHIDDPKSWANHLDVLRRIQEKTGGFSEVVPLGFVHMGAPIFLRGESRPGPTWDEVVLAHSVPRIALDGLVKNVQASWVKLGIEGASRLLNAGCNDLGGTLMGEEISSSAGGVHGYEMTPSRFEEAITSAGRVPARRDTLYTIIERV